MSDTWYREPITLPPYQDGLGRAWNFDGTAAGGVVRSPVTLETEASCAFLTHERSWADFSEQVGVALTRDYLQRLDGENAPRVTEQEAREFIAKVRKDAEEDA